jgi:hypothetical protein
MDADTSWSSRRTAAIKRLETACFRAAVALRQGRDSEAFKAAQAEFDVARADVISLRDQVATARIPRQTMAEVLAAARCDECGAVTIHQPTCSRV